MLPAEFHTVTARAPSMENTAIRASLGSSENVCLFVRVTLTSGWGKSRLSAPFNQNTTGRWRNKVEYLLNELSIDYHTIILYYPSIVGPMARQLPWPFNLFLLPHNSKMLNEPTFEET